MGFSLGLIAAMGGLMAIVLALIAVAPGGLEGTTQMMRSDEIPKLDRISEMQEMELVERVPETTEIKVEEGLGIGSDEMAKEMEEEMEETIEEEMDEEMEIVPIVRPLPEPVVAPQTHAVTLPEGSSVPGCHEGDRCYIPYSITVNEGDTVEWNNIDLAAHTVTSGTPDNGPDGVFDSALFLSGKSFEFTFDEEGVYDYFCVVHPWMIGSVIVVDAEEMHEGMEEEIEEVEEMEEIEVEEMEEIEVLEAPMAEVEEMGGPQMEAIVSLPLDSGAPGCEGTNECYIPYTVLIFEGGTVTWSNDDVAAHTVTSGSPLKGPDGLYDSGLFMAGSTFKFTFEQDGEYDYFCMVHPWMEGKVIVS